MFDGGSGYILANGTTGTPAVVDLNFGFFHFSLAEGAELPINDPNIINHSGVQIMVNTPDGGILRKMQLSREFNYDRFSGNMPYSLPQIAVDRVVNLKNGGVRAGGVFKCNAEFWPFVSAKRHIEMDNDHYDLSTTSHEYGHYVNYRLWDGACSEMSGSNSQIKEGWAIFHSFAVRGYAQSRYDEYLVPATTNEYFRQFDDNCEESPFTNPRFAWVRYARGGFPTYAAFGTYLWNLYDKYSDSYFSSPLYSGRNNDDIGEPTRVFQVMKDNEGLEYPIDFNSDFKSGMSSEFSSSVDQIYDFNIGNGSESMHSAQITAPSAEINFANKKVTLDFQGRTYPTTQPQTLNANYDNLEDGYVLYKSIGGNWTSVANANPNSTTIEYTDQSDAHGLYKITTNNQDGNSQPAYIFDFRHVVANIDGVDVLPEGETYTWHAAPIYGKAPYTYKWYAKVSSTWVQVSTSSSYTRTCNVEFDLKLEVTDSWGETDDIEWHITLSGGQWKKSPDVVNNSVSNFGLSANYPNPFSTESTIDYSIPTEGYVTLVVFDVLGQQVDALVNESLQSGKYSVILKGDKFSTGNYVVKMNFYPKDGGVLTDSKWISIVK